MIDKTDKVINTARSAQARLNALKITHQKKRIRNMNLQDKVNDLIETLN